MPNDIFPDNWVAWEIDPSTRASVHLWTKRAPVDVTLATPGTAEDLYLINPGVPTVNIVTNPGFETADPPTSYTASGATLSRSNTVARSGTYSMLINPDNAAAGEGAYWTVPSLGSGRDGNSNLYLIASAYFNDNAGSGNGARVVITDSSGTTLVNGNTVALAAAWSRSQVAYRLPASAAAYRVYLATVLQHNTSFYADDFQVEIRQSGNPTAYCDGSLGLNYEWDGTAHASTSRRRRGIAKIRGYRLHTTRDVYFAEDHVATASTGTFVRAGSDFWSEYPLDCHTRLSILNAVSGEQPRVYGTIFGVHESA